MIVIRFFRIGKKNQPSFKIVVTDKRRSSKKGRFVEEVGFYNPITKEKILKKDRIQYWVSVGAKPSASIHNLLISEKILEGKKIPVHKKSKKEAAKVIPAEEIKKPTEVVPIEKTTQSVQPEITEQNSLSSEATEDKGKPAEEEVKKETKPAEIPSTEEKKS